MRQHPCHASESNSTAATEVLMNTKDCHVSLVQTKQQLAALLMLP
jgi:hypothetical protein